MGKNSQMKIKIKNNISNVIMSNQNIFTAIKDRINDKNLGATVIVPHCCNNNDVFSGLFAKKVVSEYPIVEGNFHMYSQVSALGKTQFVPVDTNKEYGHRIFFANMICQDRLGSAKKKSRISSELFSPSFFGSSSSPTSLGVATPLCKAIFLREFSGCGS